MWTLSADCRQAWLKPILPKYVNGKFLSFSYFYKDTSGVARLEERSTATYCAVITESGELSLGLGDMDIHQQITEQYVSFADKEIHLFLCYKTHILTLCMTIPNLFIHSLLPI